MKKVIIPIIVICLAIGGYLGMTYNSMMSAQESVNGQFANIESKLQRRYDLIPNLVNAVKGSMKQEEKIFLEIANARAKLAGATTTNDKVAASNEVESAVSRLLMVVENYPELKSNSNVTNLMDELAGTENRISVERDRYNESVKGYNKKIKRFPSNIVANLFGFEGKAYFEAVKGAEIAPTVDLE